MKTKSIFFVLFAALIFTASAQSDYSSYLNKAMEELETGDCESAQKYYNVYKELSEKSKPSVQVLIDDCVKEKNKKYVIGQKILVEGKTYIIAFLNESGEHGFAIYDAGIDDIYYPHSDERVAEQKIPSWDELNIIYKNNALIGLTGVYWSRTASKKYVLQEGSAYHEILMALDFITGKATHSDCRNKKGILLLHRF